MILGGNVQDPAPRATKLAVAKTINGVAFDGTTDITITATEDQTTAGALINGSTTKATPVDADHVGLMDSAAGNVLKKLSWANVKATLKAYFDTLYLVATATATAATKLATARNINGVAFDGTGNITINAVDSTAREPAITGGTTAQYWRGDKSFQNLGALATLALGSANLKLFMNAAGNAPEFANGIKTTFFSRDISLASGSQAITGLGFKPSCVLLMGVVDGTTKASFGTDDGGGSPYALYYNGAAWTIYGGKSLEFYVSAGVECAGKVLSFDADGFTIAWTKTGAPTGTAYVIFLAFR